MMVAVVVGGGGWLVAGGWWVVAGGWWVVAGGWWLVAGGARGWYMMHMKTCVSFPPRTYSMVKSSESLIFVLQSIIVI